MDELELRRESAARNQSLFREVNERIASLAERFGDGRSATYVCECLRADCLALFELPQREYERLRERGSRFFVLHGHEDAGVEDVVETTKRYLIVEKVGAGSEVAEAMNPRKAGRVS